VQVDVERDGAHDSVEGVVGLKRGEDLGEPFASIPGNRDHHVGGAAKMLLVAMKPVDDHALGIHAVKPGWRAQHLIAAIREVRLGLQYALDELPLRLSRVLDRAQQGQDDLLDVKADGMVAEQTFNLGHEALRLIGAQMDEHLTYLGAPEEL